MEVMREELPGRPCSVAAALNLIGEKWTLLAVREITFGNKRFDAIARNTGAPRDRLAARLRTREAAGVGERRPPERMAPAALRVRAHRGGPGAAGRADRAARLGRPVGGGLTANGVR